jgi:VIT1/CCC1 family predicted Fe2+/Mn2+ transporter
MEMGHTASFRGQKSEIRSQNREREYAYLSTTERGMSSMERGHTASFRGQKSEIRSQNREREYAYLSTAERGMSSVERGHTAYKSLFANRMFLTMAMGIYLLKYSGTRNVPN